MNDKKTRNIIIAAFAVAVVGLSIGFAAFASTLNIGTSATVTPVDNFNVVFSTSDSSLIETPTGTVSVSNPNNLTNVGVAEINNEGNPTISNLFAEFTEPGQSVTYNFNVRNMSSYDAYLTDIVFYGGSSFKTCSPTGSNPGTSSLVAAACEDIKVTLNINGEDIVVNSNMSASAIKTAIGTYYIPKSSTPDTGTTNSKPVTVKIEYISGGDIADGSFKVEFNPIFMTFATTSTYVENDYEQFLPEEPVCFTSKLNSDREFAVIEDYDVDTCGTDVVIPDQVSLPVSISFNPSVGCPPLIELLESIPIVLTQEKCIVMEQELSEGSFSIWSDELGFDDDISQFTELFDELEVNYELSNSNKNVNSIGGLSYKYLTSVDFSNVTNLTSIDDGAFSNNNLTSVIIPGSVTYIGSGAFIDNPNLKDVYIQKQEDLSIFGGSTVEQVFGSGVTVHWGYSANN